MCVSVYYMEKPRRTQTFASLPKALAFPSASTIKYRSLCALRKQHFPAVRHPKLQRTLSKPAVEKPKTASLPLLGIGFDRASLRLVLARPLTQISQQVQVSISSRESPELSVESRSEALCSRW